jgi:hypothetical protein
MAGGGSHNKHGAEVDELLVLGKLFEALVENRNNRLSRQYTKGSARNRQRFGQFARVPLSTVRAIFHQAAPDWKSPM